MTPSILLHTQIALCVMLTLLIRASRADIAAVDSTKDLSLHLVSDEFDWPTTSISMYDGIDDVGHEENSGDFVEGSRRSLFWKRFGYYISYGALSANRVPCPPRSGRSYYTHDCWKSRAPVHPYTRGCSAITRCRR